jgi:AraC-like DNA-binding protein
MHHSPELPENLISVHSATRTWGCVNVVLAEFTCSGRVMYEVPHREESRIGMILDEVGAYRSEPRLKQGARCAVDYRPRQLNHVPAGMGIWGFSEDIRYARDIRLCFDAKRLGEHCQVQDLVAASVPCLRFSDEPMSSLLHLIAGAVVDPDPSSQLYGDALVTAVAARFFGQAKNAPAKSASRLSPTQLRQAIGYLDANMPQRVDLATLSSLAGLSPHHYSRAFKGSTGLAPYQWQLQARIERAKALLLGTNHPLERIAEATGFADAVHFGRIFRKQTGATPAAWRKDRGA